MDSKVSDPFGIYQGQAENYQLERPRYPDSFVKEILEYTKARHNYIDIAAGTGLLFHEIAPSFDKWLVANDFSDKQLKVCETQAKEAGFDSSRLEFIVSDSLEIPKKLTNPIKFDLVTIAQGLHWFDVGKFCSMVSEDLLAEDGTFAVAGYFCDGIDYLMPDDSEFKVLGQKRYDEFYSAISPYWQCDRVSLDKGHSNYDFAAQFADYKRSDVEVNTNISFEKFLKYMNTYSAYNVMKKKLEGTEEYVDPFKKLEADLNSDWKNYLQTKGMKMEIMNQNCLVLKMHFFLLKMRKMVVKK